MQNVLGTPIGFFSRCRGSRGCSGFWGTLKQTLNVQRSTLNVQGGGAQAILCARVARRALGEKPSLLSSRASADGEGSHRQRERHPRDRSVTSSAKGRSLIVYASRQDKQLATISGTFRPFSRERQVYGSVFKIGGAPPKAGS
jgi:hypothetical protein